MKPRLLLSLHDVTPHHFAAWLVRAEALFRELGVTHTTYLVVPRYHGAYAIEADPPFQAWCRAPRPFLHSLVPARLPPQGGPQARRSLASELDQPSVPHSRRRGVSESAGTGTERTARSRVRGLQGLPLRVSDRVCRTRLAVQPKPDSGASPTGILVERGSLAHLRPAASYGYQRPGYHLGLTDFHAPVGLDAAGSRARRSLARTASPSYRRASA